MVKYRSDERFKDFKIPARRVIFHGMLNALSLIPSLYFPPLFFLVLSPFIFLCRFLWNAKTVILFESRFVSIQPLKNDMKSFFLSFYLSFFRFYFVILLSISRLNFIRFHQTKNIKFCVRPKCLKFQFFTGLLLNR